ncbi:MAG TPA: TolC family protein [Longimicrobiaceae bacterium]
MKNGVFARGATGTRPRARLARFTLVAGLLAFAVLPASAQEPQAQEQAATPRMITFREAIELALERNPTVRTARNNLRLDEIAVRQEKTSFLPDLRFSTSTSQRYGRNFSQDEGRIINTTTNSFNGSISSGLTLFDGFANVNSLRSARLTEEAGEYEVERAEQTVVFNVMSNYLALIEAREQVVVQEENLAAQQALEADIAARVQQQVRPISDLYQQQASVASARLALVQAQRSAALAEMQLLQTLQLDPTQDYEFEIPEVSAVQTELDSLDLEEATARALQQRADFIAAQTMVQASEHQVKVARGSYWPTISLSANYSSNFSSLDETSFFDQLDNRRGGSLGVSFSIPLFDRLNTRNATERARIQVENARINLETLRQDVAVQIRTAMLDLQSAREQLAAAEAQLRAAELALQFSQQRYDVGAGSLVELTQAQTAQVRAASDLVSARYRLVFQTRLMDYYLGGMTPETPLN